MMELCRIVSWFAVPERPAHLLTAAMSQNVVLFNWTEVIGTTGYTVFYCLRGLNNTHHTRYCQVNLLLVCHMYEASVPSTWSNISSCISA